MPRKKLHRKAKPKAKQKVKRKVKPHSSNSAELIQSKFKEIPVNPEPMDSVQPVPEHGQPIPDPIQTQAELVQPSKSGERDQRNTHQQSQEKMCVFCNNTGKMGKTQTLQHPSVQNKLGELDITIP